MARLENFLRTAEARFRDAPPPQRDVEGEDGARHRLDDPAEDVRAAGGASRKSLCRSREAQGAAGRSAYQIAVNVARGIRVLH